MLKRIWKTELSINNSNYKIKTTMFQEIRNKKIDKLKLNIGKRKFAMNL